MEGDDRESMGESPEETVTDRILTIPNVISAIRLVMAFVSLAVLLQGYDIAATILFSITALTDFVDGQIARRTHTVSKLGQLLDPTVDRVLMICAVVGLLLLGRLPLWVVLIVIIRDLILLFGGAWLLSNFSIRIPVVYAGKVATTFLFVGLAGLILNWPLIPGLGICRWPWLPGFNSMATSWGIWAIYIGLVIAIITTVYYIVQAIKQLRKVLAARNDARA